METIPSDIYIKGFNNGYFLAEHNPILIEQLIKTESNLEYIEALRDGKKSFELDKNKHRIKEIRKLRNKNWNKNLDL